MWKVSYLRSLKMSCQTREIPRLNRYRTTLTPRSLSRGRRPHRFVVRQARPPDSLAP